MLSKNKIGTQGVIRESMALRYGEGILGGMIEYMMSRYDEEI